jgi:hypothetical protein
MTLLDLLATFDDGQVADLTGQDPAVARATMAAIIAGLAALP